MEIDPSVVLEKARKALRNKDYEVALEKYQWFFHNSIEINRSYYGVRLSYCLSEWKQLANDYPPAMEALIELKNNTLATFLETYSRQSFHEYKSIAGCLNEPKEVFDQFMIVHNSNKELAKNLFTFVYEYCAENNNWEICLTYLGNGNEQYEEALEMLDHMIEFSEKKDGEAGKSIFNFGTERFEKECLWILCTLNHANASEALDSAYAKIQSDLKDRNLDDLLNKITTKMPNN